MANLNKKHFLFNRNLLRAILLLPVLVCISFSPPEAENESHTKALFIYNFVKYIHWPEDDGYDIFTIGVLGKTETTDELKKICENKIINDKAIHIVQVNATEKVDECQAIFIVRSQSFLLDDVLDLIDKRGTLVITEAKGIDRKSVV